MRNSVSLDQTESNELSRNYFGGCLTKVLQANQFVGTQYVHSVFLEGFASSIANLCDRMYLPVWYGL